MCIFCGALTSLQFLVL